MTDRLRNAIRAVLQGMLPTLPNFLKWRYAVVGVTPGRPVTISGTPVSSNCPHGDLANITLRPGPDGGYAVPAIGSIVTIEFIEGNPELPEVCGLDPSVPATLTTLGGGAIPVARAGDPVRVTFSVTAPSGGGPCTITPGGTAVSGTIVSGSSKVVTA